MKRASIAAGVALVAATTIGAVAATAPTSTPAGPPAVTVIATGPARDAVTAGIHVAPDGALAGYDRDRYGRGWAAWPGHPGCDTRDEVLLRDLTDTVAEGTCNVVGGRFRDSYSGATTVGPTRGLDIDHVYPLALAWQTGAAAWSPARRAEFANDLGNLRAVNAHDNRAKGDSGPEAWLPATDRCGYARNFADVARRYGLTVTPARRDALERTCLR